MNRPIIIFFISVCLLLFAQSAFCQVVPPAPNAGAPIDGFSGLLLALGVGYGALKMGKSK